jgi:hypothetical protein
MNKLGHPAILRQAESGKGILPGGGDCHSRLRRPGLAGLSAHAFSMIYLRRPFQNGHHSICPDSMMQGQENDYGTIPRELTSLQPESILVQ